MHPEDLKIIWICVDCLAKFVFHSDVDDHKLHTGHFSIRKYDLLSGEMIMGIDSRINEKV
jgi:hypothetical protein